MLPILCFWSPPWIDFSISRFPHTYCQFALPPILQIYLLVVTKLECHINSTTLDAFSDYWPPIPNEFYKIAMIWLDYMQSPCCSKWLCASKKCQPLKCKIIAICDRLFYSCVRNCGKILNSWKPAEVITYLLIKTFEFARMSMIDQKKPTLQFW